MLALDSHRTGVIYGALLLVNLVNITLLWNRWRGDEKIEYTWLGRDYPHTFSVDIDQVLMTMDFSPHFPTPDQSADFSFLTLLPSNGGYLRFPPSDRAFDLSIYHELHCFRMLNLAFLGSPKSGMGHNRHCIDYLRMMGLCASDVALEPLTREDEDFMYWDTEHATHTCRDWTALYKIEQENWEGFKVRNATRFEALTASRGSMGMSTSNNSVKMNDW